MLASVYLKYGSPVVLQIIEVKTPVPKDNEVLVRVHAATVNRTDCAMLRAKPFIMRFMTGLFKPSNTILGTDFAGKVEAVGKNVKSFEIGDKVFGFNDDGLSSHAQYLVLSEDKGLAVIPENITFEQATASLEGAHYAYNFINKVNIKNGHKVLVNGATGAIGSAAVQLLKYFGADVIAVCDSENKELVKSLGADRIIDYTKNDFTKEEEKYDYVFDTVGKSSYGKCKPVLKTGGVYISSEPGWMAQNLLFALVTPFIDNKKVVFPMPLDIKASVLLVKTLIENGDFKSVIDREYPLEDIAEAFNYVETGEKIGNVVITVGK